MKFGLTGIILLTCLLVKAQENVPLTDNIVIEGEIKAPHVFTWKEIRTFEQLSLDSVVIYNHRMEARRTIKDLKVVLLKDLLSKVEFNAQSPKALSEFYIVCVAADSYTVVFSWNEIFNTDVGKRVSVIIEADHKAGDQRDDRIALLSPADQATGRRYVKGLQKIIIKHVE